LIRFAFHQNTEAMKKIYTFLSILVGTISVTSAQTNMLSTNPVAEQIMLGNFDPGQYMPSTVISHPDDIVPAIIAGISTD
jgi:hypothetical protein